MMTEHHSWEAFCAQAGKELRRRKRNQVWLKSLVGSWRINTFYGRWEKRYKRIKARHAEQKRLTVIGYGEWA